MMKRDNSTEFQTRNRPMARATFLLSAGLIAAAWLIGYISYKLSFQMMAKSYQAFYLNKAQMIIKSAELFLVGSDGELLNALTRSWKSAVDKPNDEYVCVVDENGKLLLHTANPTVVGNYAGDNPILGDAEMPEKKLCDLVYSQKNYVGKYISSAGEDQIAAFYAIPQKKWILGVHRSYKALHGEIENVFRPLLYGFILVCGLLMPLSLFFLFQTYSAAQRKQMKSEHALKDSEQKYQSLVDAMPQCLYRADLEGRLTFGNKAFLQWVGLSKEEILGNTEYDFFPEILARQFLDDDSKVINTGTILDEVLEYFASGDTDRAFLEVVKHPVFNTNGEIVGLQGIFWDVTDKKRAEENLKHLKAQLETVLRSVPSGIIAVNGLGLFTIMNKKAEEILGFSEGDALGRPVQELIPNTGLTKVLAEGKKELGKPFSWGSTSLIVSRSPILEEGETVGAVSVLQDASELEAIQKQLEKEQRLNDELSSLIQNSHDGILITDSDRVLKVNPSFGRITGLAPSILEGKRVSDLHSENHICLAVAQTVFKHVKTHHSSMTLRRQLKNENEIFVTGNPVFDKSGEVVRVVMNVRDVTELKALEDRIKKLTTAKIGLTNDTKYSLQATFGIVAESPLSKNMLDLAARVARVDSTVLLSGESGVGKDVMARLIHKLSDRHDKPFVPVNCGAIPENLLESELFGYEKGAFSGADRHGKPGLFEEAKGGVIFLDEVAELPLSLQVKLLKVLQEQSCRRLGSVKTIDLDIRILSATNRDLKAMMKAGDFRGDLFYRLYVVPMEIPPLRERREDILPLAMHFLKTYNERYKVSRTLGRELLQVLEAYQWPGNVRELQNVIERTVVTADAEVLEPHHLPSSVYPGEAHPRKPQVWAPEGVKLVEARDQLEKHLIQKALIQTNNIREAAKLLGVAHSTVVRKAQKFGLKINGKSTLTDA
jgi:PAS domain S-box-containing protein